MGREGVFRFGGAAKLCGPTRYLTAMFFSVATLGVACAVHVLVFPSNGWVFGGMLVVRRAMKMAEAPFVWEACLWMLQMGLPPVVGWAMCQRRRRDCVGGAVAGGRILRSLWILEAHHGRLQSALELCLLAYDSDQVVSCSVICFCRSFLVILEAFSTAHGELFSLSKTMAGAVGRAFVCSVVASSALLSTHPVIRVDRSLPFYVWQCCICLRALCHDAAPPHDRAPSSPAGHCQGLLAHVVLVSPRAFSALSMSRPTRPGSRAAKSVSGEAFSFSKSRQPIRPTSTI